MATAISISTVKAQIAVPATKAEEAVNFYKAAFGAEEVARFTYPKRKGDQETLADVMCAEMKIGGLGFLVCGQNDENALFYRAIFMLGQLTGFVGRCLTRFVLFGAWLIAWFISVIFGSPTDLSLVLETDDVDAAILKAVDAGAVIACAVKGSRYGGRVGKVKDPFGVVWNIASFGKKKCNDAA